MNSSATQAGGAAADPGRRPTMKDVARAAGVGLKTVSRVVNDEPGVTDATAERVREAAASLGYRFDHSARSLRRGDRRTMSIGLLLSWISNPFDSALHQSVEEAARGHRTAVLAASSHNEPELEQERVGALLARQVDGVVIAPSAGDQGYLRSEMDRGTPMVFVDRAPSGIDADAVVSGNARGTADAVAHLHAAGHRRIAFIGESELVQTARERRRGFLDAVRELGLAEADCPAHMGTGREDDAGDLVRRMFGGGAGGGGGGGAGDVADGAADVAGGAADGAVRPTALVAGQNLVAVAAVRTLRELGLHHDIALVAFDDLPIADLLDPPVTAVVQDPVRIGREAVALLFERIDAAAAGTPGPPPRTVVVPTRLIPRGSGEIPPAR